MEDGGTCRYINVESATAYWRGAGCSNRKLDSLDRYKCSHIELVSALHGRDCVFKASGV